MDYALVATECGGCKVRKSDNKNENGPVTEMAIVNTFTKLIFGDEVRSPRELSIIASFRSVDAGVLRDSHEELGEYLRNLGVREMIQLVSRLRQHMNDPAFDPAAIRGQAAPSASAGWFRHNGGSR